MISSHVKSKSVAHPAKAKAPPAPTDVLVLGAHPSAYLAAALLIEPERGKSLEVTHATLPLEDGPDRLVLLNPAAFALHPPLESMRRRLEMTAIYGAQFLSGEPGLFSEHRSKSAMGYVVSLKALRVEFARVAEQAGVPLLTPKHLEVKRLDEKGVEVVLNGKQTLRPRAIVLGGHLPPDQQKMLGLPESWGQGVIHNYSFVKLPIKRAAALASRPVMPMSLSLCDTLCWAWMLPSAKYVQLSIAQPLELVGRFPPAELLRQWAGILHGANLLTKADIADAEVEQIQIPLAGALAHEGVANRTLLVGPAGGFYCASGEDVYPNCWSAVFAADVMKRALKEPHLQDALNPYRAKWRTTLGQYLRGPQQDFRFLLPLIYRNQVMTARLTESILLGKSVVR